MAIIKCKMCGGDIELAADKTFGTCEFCGSLMTFPKVEDDQRAAIFNRGNHFRRIGEFDKALAIYENIVRENDTDAEAHWCCALCRFGIEYVEDPTTYEYLPTCHRASFDSFLEDVDYLAAVEHSEGVTKRQYQKDAAKIAEVQRGILATSQNEKPFDVFICYKESDENGERTRDSMMAQDVYYQLTEQGYRVFFARITLENMAGKQYEPYIFAALNSAKVMIVIGTKAEYMNAVWVKNEWSRFLAMMRKDRHKILLPCYRDMDPYDMPEQLSVLQSYDMGKIGFIQDLTRGIGKVLDAEKKQEVVQETVVVQQPSTSTAPLLQRAFIFLEDGDWNSADEYCEKVLDLEPQNAQAYLGKLMAELRVKKQELLKDQAEPFDQRNNFQKVVRFADDQTKKNLLGYIQHINERNENARLDGIYNNACKVMFMAIGEGAFKEAARLFESVSGYLDSAARAQECHEKAEITRKDAVLALVKQKMTSDQVFKFEEAIALLETIPGWKDADERVVVCHEKIKELKAKAEAFRLEQERLQVIAQRERKRKEKIAITIASIVCAVVVLVVLLHAVIIPNIKYNKAIALMDAGKYDEAITAFEKMDGYKDSEAKIDECNLGKKYNKAIDLMDSGMFAKAWDRLIALDGYKDSREIANQIYLESRMEILKSAEVGNNVFFGFYEQDNDTSNGQEEIEWIVLDKEDDKVLVISKYVLDWQSYNAVRMDVSWRDSTLRQWLNNEFFNTAFSGELNENLSAASVYANTTEDGATTSDKVFLLSKSEVRKYFATTTTRQCQATDYAKAAGVLTGSVVNACWWLENYKSDSIHYPAVNDSGVIERTQFVSKDRNGVRPAMWIDLSE